MKSIGFLLITLGVLIAYLGYNGKISDAVTAIKTGVAPSGSSNSGGSSNTQTSGDVSNGAQVVA